MRTVFILFLLHGCMMLVNLSAQPPQVFGLYQIEMPSNKIVPFISLSDVIPLSEHPDSLLLPDLSNSERDSTTVYDYLVLENEYRQRLLSALQLSEKDTLFVFDYNSGICYAQCIQYIHTVAHLNMYGAEWPYRQDDYMIGFEPDNSLNIINNDNQLYLIASAGKENPFARQNLEHIKWKLLPPRKFPEFNNKKTDAEHFGKLKPLNLYGYENREYYFFLEDMVAGTSNEVTVRRLLVLQKKDNRAVLIKYFYTGESATLAELEYQFTGKLFNNMPDVVFGFQWHAFGCPEIYLIDSNKYPIIINCDNRH